MSLQLMGNSIGTLRNPLGTFTIPHKCPIQTVKFHFISRSVFKRALELMANTLTSTFQKEVVGSLILPFGIISPPQVLLMKDLVQKTSSKLYEWMEVEISSIVKFFKLCRGGIEAKSWGKIRAFRFVRLQSTVNIFLARDHMGGVHNDARACGVYFT